MVDHRDFNDLLKDDGLMAAWTLTNEGTLSEQERKEAMENFSAYLKRHGLNHKDVARQLGRPNTTTIYDLARGVYRERADEHIRKLNLWIEQHARQRAGNLADPFVDTYIATTMINAAKAVRDNGTIAFVYGPTGIGKSRCALEIQRSVVGSMYFRVTTDARNPRALRFAVAGLCGARELRRVPGRRSMTVMERIIERLRDSHRLLIIDEAHHLSDDGLEVLRDIHDTTGIPMMLIAIKDLYDRIRANVTPDAGQLHSRIDITHPLTRGRNVRDGGRRLYSIEDIRKLYHRAPVRLAKNAENYLLDVANRLGEGSLRRCGILLRNAARRARKRQSIGDGGAMTVSAADLQWVATKFRPGDETTAEFSIREVNATATA